jgi:hypothetical protein
MTDAITFKEFKQKIKDAGYAYKTHVPNFGMRPHRHLEIVDKNTKEFICGSGANVYTADWIRDHQKAFDLIREYRDRVFDEEGDKVLF